MQPDTPPSASNTLPPDCPPMASLNRSISEPHTVESSVPMRPRNNAAYGRSRVQSMPSNMSRMTLIELQKKVQAVSPEKQVQDLTLALRQAHSLRREVVDKNRALEAQVAALIKEVDELKAAAPQSSIPSTSTSFEPSGGLQVNSGEGDRNQTRRLSTLVDAVETLHWRLDKAAADRVALESKIAEQAQEMDSLRKALTESELEKTTLEAIIEEHKAKAESFQKQLVTSRWKAATHLQDLAKALPAHTVGVTAPDGLDWPGFQQWYTRSVLQGVPSVRNCSVAWHDYTDQSKRDW